MEFSFELVLQAVGLFAAIDRSFGRRIARANQKLKPIAGLMHLLALNNNEPVGSKVQKDKTHG